MILICILLRNPSERLTGPKRENFAIAASDFFTIHFSDDLQITGACSIIVFTATTCKLLANGVVIWHLRGCHFRAVRKRKLILDTL